MFMNMMKRLSQKIVSVLMIQSLVKFANELNPEGLNDKSISRKEFISSYIYRV